MMGMGKGRRPAAKPGMLLCQEPVQSACRGADTANVAGHKPCRKQSRRRLSLQQWPVGMQLVAWQ